MSKNKELDTSKSLEVNTLTVYPIDNDGDIEFDITEGWGTLNVYLSTEQALKLANYIIKPIHTKLNRLLGLHSINHLGNNRGFKNK